ncbi:MAG: Hpt domain-containing protein [Bryobacteraceae bacterium]
MRNDVLDLEQLRNATLEDQDLMREIVGALIDDTARQIGALHRAILNEDANECMRLAHYSKGACASVGARSSAELFQGIERRAASGDFAACRESLRRLTGELEKLRAQALAAL